MAQTTITGVGTVTYKRADYVDGWVVTDPDGDRTLYLDRGGEWSLDRDGRRARQLQGTCDVQAPRDAAAMRRFVRREFSEWCSDRVTPEIAEEMRRESEAQYAAWASLPDAGYEV